MWTFVQVCRILGKDKWILDLEPKDEISPIAFADAMKKVQKIGARVRATREKRRRV